MTSQSVEDVVDSTAVAILCDLERDGVRVELAPDDAIVITPKSCLTPHRRQQIIDHKDVLKALLRSCADDGVRVRRDAFQRQLAATPAPHCPAFQFRANVPYAKGICFSCSATLPAPQYGRCWRCSLAWRLACRLPVDASLAAALDAAKVVS